MKWKFWVNDYVLLGHFTYKQTFQDHYLEYNKILVNSKDYYCTIKYSKYFNKVKLDNDIVNDHPIIVKYGKPVVEYINLKLLEKNLTIDEMKKIIKEFKPL